MPVGTKNAETPRRTTFRNIVDAGQSNPELRKEMIYSWEKGFVEDNEEENTQSARKRSFGTKISEKAARP